MVNFKENESVTFSTRVTNGIMFTAFVTAIFPPLFNQARRVKAQGCSVQPSFSPL